MAFEAYLLLPPGIPFLTSFGLIPFQLRLSNYVMLTFVAVALWTFGFSLIESLALASIWLTVAVYLVIDFIYNVPLAL